jgi:hypothetical protein
MSTGDGLSMSVRQRLQNVAIRTGEPFQLVMERYSVERFLYRLGKSAHVDSFVLKGATLFWVWQGHAHRPTRDLDMLRIGLADPSTLQMAIIQICSHDCSDGLQFDLDSLTLEPIRGLQEYGGTRACVLVLLGSARLKLQIDIGVGDAITPAAIQQSFPSLLGMEAPSIKCYPIETVIAEKLEAIVSRGAENSRMKDFFDLKFILDRFDLDGATVATAVGRTFERRGTTIPSDIPYALTPSFFNSDLHKRQWRSFVAKARLGEGSGLAEVCFEIGLFAAPVFRACKSSNQLARQWLDRKWIEIT